MENKQSGFIIVNKSSGPTSHDIIDRLRKITGIKKIGHAGTLDPFATGVLICALHREATREISRFVKLDKEYEATLRLGVITDTYDRMGIKSLKSKVYKVQLKDVKRILNSFIGKQEQIPPMFSAKKVGGQKLYKLARAGKEIERKPQKINIYNIELIRYKWPNLEIKVNCSTGVYIRSLGHDIGQALKCGAYLEELKRIAVGEFRLKDAVDLKKLTQENWKEYLF